MENRIIPMPENVICANGDLVRQPGSYIFTLDESLDISVDTESLVLVYSMLNILQPQTMKVPGPMLPISSDTMSSGTSEPYHQILFRAPYSEDLSILQVRYMNMGTLNGVVKNGVSISCSVKFPASYAEIGGIEMQLIAGAIIVG